MTLLVIYIMIAIGVSFVCSVLEAVLLSVTATFIVQTRQKNPRAGELLAKTKLNLDQSISSILILNTIAHTMGAAGVGAQAVRVYGEQWETLIAFSLTLAILYFSEIIPKTLGVTFWRQLALPSAYCISFLVKITFPLVWLATRVTSLFRRNKNETISREEILAFTALSYKEGGIVTQENLLIENIFKLRDTKVEDILTPRTVMHALPETMTVEEALSAAQTAIFTRIPVYSESIDRITGMIIKGQLYECERHGQGDKQLQDIKQPFYRISKEFPVLNALDLFIKRHEQLFLVDDRFGQTVGVVTLEDVMETLLGREIIDESDQVADMQKLAKEHYRERLRKQTKL
ncbi:CNNM domain-containing protein [Psychromonas antarctica]|uniref:CNNM domain-containing protein n=1 Tax=Psychromonas antarctica TaxID=67573 RepID=UPI001EE81A7A|nr:CNNM domain-containing protein [Psychromonas antarctica]MCG6200919.1 CNNM domain-containing protein [Psychromonas antarctica]